MVMTQPVPHVARDEQITQRALGQGVFDVIVRYGFMEDPDIPAALRLAREQGLEIDHEDVTYFLGRETLIVSRAPGMAMWRERLFVLMARNAVRATAFFRLPPERVVELGVQVEISSASPKLDGIRARAYVQGTPKTPLGVAGDPWRE